MNDETPTAEPVTTIEAKPLYKSLTIIFNVLALLAVIADWATGQGFAFVTQDWFIAAVTAINFILRFKTVRPVATSAKMVSLPKYHND